MPRAPLTYYHRNHPSRRPPLFDFSDLSSDSDDGFLGGPPPLSPSRVRLEQLFAGEPFALSQHQHQHCQHSPSGRAVSGRASTQREFQQQWRHFVRSTSMSRLTASNAVAPLGDMEAEHHHHELPPDAPAAAHHRRGRRGRENGRRMGSHTAMAVNCCVSTWAVFLGAYHLFTGFFMVGECAKILANFSNSSCAPMNASKHPLYFMDFIKINDTDPIVGPTVLRMGLYLNTGFLGLVLICGTLKRSRNCLVVWIIWFCTLEINGYLQTWEFEPLNLPASLWKCFIGLCEVSLVSMAKNEMPMPRVAGAGAGPDGGTNVNRAMFLLDADGDDPFMPDAHVHAQTNVDLSQRAPDPLTFNTRTPTPIRPALTAVSEPQPQPLAPTESVINSSVGANANSNTNVDSYVPWWPPGEYN